MDSLGAVELRNSIQTRFGIELPATVTFDYPTATAMASYISSQRAPLPTHAPQSVSYFNTAALASVCGPLLCVLDSSKTFFKGMHANGGS